ncbi:hypothetical protein ACHAXR_004673 [Thalassiosira sp. AJA248-18]
MPKYETIPILDEEDAQAPTTTSLRSEGNDGLLSTSKLIGGGLLAIFLVVLAVNYSTGGDEASILALGKGKTNAPCTFKECYASNCNHKVAPFTCLFHNGGPHGGCSPTPWVAGTCTKQCDLSHCSGMDIPKGTESCDKKCKKEVCIGDRLCHSDAPYQCTSGSAAFGCSAEKLEWTLKTSPQTCSSCCDASTCKD